MGYTLGKGVVRSSILLGGTKKPSKSKGSCFPESLYIAPDCGTNREPAGECGGIVGESCRAVHAGAGMPTAARDAASCALTAFS